MYSYAVASSLASRSVLNPSLPLLLHGSGGLAWVVARGRHLWHLSPQDPRFQTPGNTKGCCTDRGRFRCPDSFCHFHCSTPTCNLSYPEHFSPIYSYGVSYADITWKSSVRHSTAHTFQTRQYFQQAAKASGPCTHGDWKHPDYQIL